MGTLDTTAESMYLGRRPVDRVAQLLRYTDSYRAGSRGRRGG
ncbi:hypothetical protein [Streptomyces sp. SLBN-118]|nr:hypothetical protein [Streptomyces sp. SLBN-118]